MSEKMIVQHKTYRSQAISTRFGVVAFDHDGCAEVDVEIGQYLTQAMRNEFSTMTREQLVTIKSRVKIIPKANLTAQAAVVQKAAVAPAALTEFGLIAPKADAPNNATRLPEVAPDNVSRVGIPFTGVVPQSSDKAMITAVENEVIPLNPVSEIRERGRMDVIVPATPTPVAEAMPVYTPELAPDAPATIIPATPDATPDAPATASETPAAEELTAKSATAPVPAPAVAPVVEKKASSKPKKGKGSKKSK